MGIFRFCDEVGHIRSGLRFTCSCRKLQGAWKANEGGCGVRAAEPRLDRDEDNSERFWILFGGSVMACQPQTASTANPKMSFVQPKYRWEKTYSPLKRVGEFPVVRFNLGIELLLPFCSWPPPFQAACQAARAQRVATWVEAKLLSLT